MCERPPTPLFYSITLVWHVLHGLMVSRELEFEILAEGDEGWIEVAEVLEL